MTIPGNFIAGDILTASDMNALAGGYITHSSLGTNQTGFTSTPSDLGSSVTWTAGTSRRYLLLAKMFGTQNTSGGVLTITLTNSSNTLIDNMVSTSVSAGTSQIHYAIAFYQPSSGSTTVKLRAQTSGGTWDAINATVACQLYVFDMGT